MTEEEVRGKLLLPYLNNLGFDVSEISLEKSFSIKLGKTKHIVSGRSDILCSRNGKNLFIIELKNDDITITQDDIDQGISYARLLEDIAPFTLITNGKTTRVFDSITRKELAGSSISNQSSFWKNGCILATDVDLKIRYEALTKFVSFTPENLKKFCENQVSDRMGPIIGNIDAPTSKFVRELHIQRQGLQNAFIDFVNSSSSVFAIVGAAGVGKTGAMCSLALQSLENSFVFFYNAAIINKSPIELISQDLNIVFSNKSESDTVLKRLDELGKFLDKTILIFIDALDENTLSELSIELSEIALSVRNLDRVKICISCKLSLWSSILSVQGDNTHLHEELIKTHGANSEIDNRPGYLLKDFSDKELNSIIPLYKQVFGFKGEISGSLLKELRNGFFLRIFSEVYSHKEVPQKINDRILIKRYIQQSLEKTGIGFQAGTRILSKIGMVILQQNYSDLDAYYDKGLEINTLIEELGFTINESIPEELFSRNILIKSNTDESFSVSFYYSKIRDYIICFHSFKLDKLNSDEFYNSAHWFYRNYIGQSAMFFYMQNASYDHKHALAKFKKDKALAYVNAYENYLDTHFKNFKKEFNPNTNGEIGIFIPRDLINEDGYALYPFDPNFNNKVRQEKFDSPFSGGFGDNLFNKEGITKIYGSHYNLLIEDQVKTVRQNVFKELEDIVKKGKLIGYSSDVLLHELVSTILYFYSERLNFSFSIRDFYLPRYELIYPIDLKDLKERIYKFRVVEHFRRQRISPSLREQKIKEAISQNYDIPRLRIIGDFPPFEELFKIVNILLSRGYRTIENHHLPYPDKSVTEIEKLDVDVKFRDITRIRNAQFTEQRAYLYIECFFKQLESSYRDFVDWYFPTLKHGFSFYTGLPHEYYFYIEDTDSIQHGMFGYKQSQVGEFKINFRSRKPIEDAWQEDGIDILRGFSLNSILHNRYSDHIKTIDRINTSKVDDFCIMRNWVYKLLREDLKDIFKENKR